MGYNKTSGMSKPRSEPHPERLSAHDQLPGVGRGFENDLTPSTERESTVSSLGEAIRTLFWHLSRRRRRALLPLFVLMLIGAVAEVATLGALLPFLGVITAPESSGVLERLRPLLATVNASEPPQAIYVLTALFATAALISAGLRLLLLRMSSGYANSVVYELAVKLYDKVLHEPYSFHIRRNSSEVIAGVNKVEFLLSNLLMPLLNGAVAVVISIFIIVGLVVIDAGVALAAGIGFSTIYLLATWLTRNRLRHNSRISAAAHDQRVKVMQEGLGGIRDVLISQLQPVFLETFDRAVSGLRRARTLNTFYEGAPRYLVEGLGMVLIAGVAVVLTGRPGGVVEAIPILGALALGALRLLPLIQMVYSGWASITGSQQLVFDVVNLLGPPKQLQTKPKHYGDKLPLREAISFESVSFAYAPNTAPVLKEFSLTIPQGARVGIVGKTGSGKSTLADLLLGLLMPTSGRITIDGTELDADGISRWQENVAHVPQSLFLADASIAENIAFGQRYEEIDHELVRHAAKQAELTDVISKLPDGYETRVGERGVQLSGGQRQRIGIARALYRQAKVLVFDEATSALDNDTEAAVMTAIEGLDRSLTIVIIAHRLSTLTGCDTVIHLEEGRGAQRSLISLNRSG